MFFIFKKYLQNISCNGQSKEGLAKHSWFCLLGNVCLILREVDRHGLQGTPVVSVEKEPRNERDPGEPDHLIFKPSAQIRCFPIHFVWFIFSTQISPRNY